MTGWTTGPGPQGSGALGLWRWNWQLIFLSRKSIKWLKRSPKWRQIDTKPLQREGECPLFVVFQWSSSVGGGRALSQSPSLNMVLLNWAWTRLVALTAVWSWHTCRLHLSGLNAAFSAAGNWDVSEGVQLVWCCFNTSALHHQQWRRRYEVDSFPGNTVVISGGWDELKLQSDAWFHCTGRWLCLFY